MAVLGKSMQFSFGVSHPSRLLTLLPVGYRSIWNGPGAYRTRQLFLVCGGERFTLFLKGASPGMASCLSAALPLLPGV